MLSPIHIRGYTYSFPVQATSLVREDQPVYLFNPAYSQTSNVRLLFPFSSQHKSGCCSAAVRANAASTTRWKNKVSNHHAFQRCQARLGRGRPLLCHTGAYRSLGPDSPRCKRHPYRLGPELWKIRRATGPGERGLALRYRHEGLRVHGPDSRNWRCCHQVREGEPREAQNKECESASSITLQLLPIRLAGYIDPRLFACCADGREIRR